ncbi:MAG: hypothetical protein ACE14M_16720 [Terriglobales bacterium]
MKAKAQRTSSQEAAKPLGGVEGQATAAGEQACAQVQSASSVFVPGTIVLVTLCNPREKFWGVLRELALTGLSVCGIELNSFDDFCSLVKSGDAVAGCEVFFPMHRVERVELDARSGPVPSLTERFQRTTGRSATTVFGVSNPAVTREPVR